MVIFMAGFPYAGKTFVLDKALEKIEKEVTVICPKDYRDNNYKNLEEEEQRQMNIAAWETSLEMLWESMQTNKNEEIIIYDTACASLKHMRPYFDGAKKYEHRVIYLYVNASLDLCAQRAGDSWLPIDVIKSYKNKFSESIKELARSADKHLIINNNSDKDPEVSKIIELLV